LQSQKYVRGVATTIISVLPGWWLLVSPSPITKLASVVEVRLFQGEKLAELHFRESAVFKLHQRMLSSARCWLEENPVVFGVSDSFLSLNKE
jgi:hypothetical protein